MSLRGPLRTFVPICGAILLIVLVLGLYLDAMRTPRREQAGVTCSAQNQEALPIPVLTQKQGFTTITLAPKLISLEPILVYPSTVSVNQTFIVSIELRLLRAVWSRTITTRSGEGASEVEVPLEDLQPFEKEQAIKNLKQSSIEACLLLAGMDVVPEARGRLTFEGDVLWSLRPHSSGSYEGAVVFALPTTESATYGINIKIKPPKVDLPSKLRFSLKVTEPSLLSRLSFSHMAGIILSIFLIALPVWIDSDKQLSNT